MPDDAPQVFIVPTTQPATGTGIQGAVVGFRIWRMTAEGLRSRLTSTIWHGGVLQATCLPRTPEDFARPPHEAPNPDCRCGIYVDFAPDHDVCGVDANAITGIVAVSGRLIVEDGCARCERARVVALATHGHWSSRQHEAAVAAAADLGCELVPADELHALALALGNLPNAPQVARAAEPLPNRRGA